MDLVDYQLIDNVGFLTLNRPERSNALNWDLVRELEHHIETIRQMSPKGLFLRANGRTFCAGLDRNEMRRILQHSSEQTAKERFEFYNRLVRLATLEIPTVAVLEGPAITGGVGLAALCDFRLATPAAWLRVTFNELGFYLGLGMSVTIPAIAGLNLARRLLLLGERISAQEAYRYGFFDWMVQPDQVEAKILELAELVRNGDALVVGMMKQRLHSYFRTLIMEEIYTESILEAFTKTTQSFAERVQRFIASN